MWLRWLEWKTILDPIWTNLTIYFGSFWNLIDVTAIILFIPAMVLRWFFYENDDPSKSLLDHESNPMRSLRFSELDTEVLVQIDEEPREMKDYYQYGKIKWKFCVV